MDPRPRVGQAVDYPRMRAGLLTLRERLAEVRETVESDDGLITVTVGARNELLDLELDPRVFRTPDSAALAAGILGTTRRAAERVRVRLHELTRALLTEPEGVRR